MKGLLLRVVPATVGLVTAIAVQAVSGSPRVGTLTGLAVTVGVTLALVWVERRWTR